MKLHHTWHLILFLFVPPAISSCASPAATFDQLAEQSSVRKSTIEGMGFTHAVYAKGDVVEASRVHVYLGSDGLPWAQNMPTADPTPRKPIGLSLMMEDPAASIYVGRPCYHGVEQGPGCHDELWTHGRYSETVVKSLSAAIENFRIRNGIHSVVLVGYSGGGTLAVLVAPRLSNVAGVITVGSNLDTDAWTEFHGYEPLAGSLNPAEEHPDAEKYPVVHLFGADDQVVPLETAARFLENTPSAKVVVLQSFGHTCCWVRDWQQILQDVL